MEPRAEVLVHGCRDDDLEVLRGVWGAAGPIARPMESPVKLAQQAVRRPPLAVILGVDRRTGETLDVLPVIRTVHRSLPVIVIAGEDSLDLERKARQAGVFYYFVHPIDRAEAEAVFQAVVRHEKGVGKGSSEAL